VGLILDSSVVITGERRGHTVRQILEQFKAAHGELEIGLPVVTIVELVHGIQRAQEEQRRTRRQALVDELIRDVPVHPVTIEVARCAGRLEGERAAQGVTIAFEDLLIAALQSTRTMTLSFGMLPYMIQNHKISYAPCKDLPSVPGLYC
jgi:predicted nucleic acid-binding protein